MLKNKKKNKTKMNIDNFCIAEYKESFSILLSSTKKLTQIKKKKSTADNNILLIKCFRQCVTIIIVPSAFPCVLLTVINSRNGTLMHCLLEMSVPK